MRLMLVVLLLVCACAKKKSEDKTAAPPAPSEQAAPAPTDLPKAEGATPAVGGAPGSADPKATMPSDDGGEAKTRATMPSDDGGEAAKKACTKTEDCGANHDCCNGFCFKQGSPKHSIECKLPAGTP